MSTVLFLTPRFPWPLVGGDRVKSYYLLRHLAATHRVILVTFNHGSAPSADQRDAIECLGIELHAVHLDPVRAGLASARTFTSDLPLEIAFYTRPDFKRVVDDILRREHIDLGISFFMRTAEYLRHARIPKILIAEDCRVEYQTRSSNAARTPHQKVVRWWETRKLRSYEPRVVHDFDVTTFVSPEDVQAMRTLEPKGTYAVVTNGVDLDRFVMRENLDGRSGLLFAGKLDVLANHLMAEQIVREILPNVQRAVPETMLTIAGANPSSSLRAMATSHVRVEGNVPDLVPYLHQAAVFIHPHHGGSGIQNKVLEAMAAGCPVVTTRSGMQGIEAEHGVHALIGTSVQELQQHVITLLGDVDLRRRLAHNARRLMEETHTWSVVGQQLDAVIAPFLHAPLPSDPWRARPSSSTVTV